MDQVWNPKAQLLFRHFDLIKNADHWALIKQNKDGSSELIHQILGAVDRDDAINVAYDYCVENKLFPE